MRDGERGWRPARPPPMPTPRSSPLCSRITAQSALSERHCVVGRGAPRLGADALRLKSQSSSPKGSAIASAACPPHHITSVCHPIRRLLIHVTLCHHHSSPFTLVTITHHPSP
eukprot:2309474-Rhodomonas_salina.1